MPFRPGQGGRPKGSPNKRTKAKAEALAKYPGVKAIDANLKAIAYFDARLWQAINEGKPDSVILKLADMLRSFTKDSLPYEEARKSPERDFDDLIDFSKFSNKQLRDLIQRIELWKINDLREVPP
jgi:hypothetical protein